jgi:ribosome-associated protein
MRSLADRLREQFKAEADDRDLTSRTDRRREQNVREDALKALAVGLVSLKAKQLERLPKSELLLYAIEEAQRLRSPMARNRQVNVVRQHLRDLAPEAVEVLEAGLDALKRGALPELIAPVVDAPPVAAPSTSALSLWSQRLVDDGDAALDAFVLAHPDADRQALRQHARALAKLRRAASGGNALVRAEQRLRAEVERALR